MANFRYLIWSLGFYACGLMFSYRAALSVAIVSMVKQKSNATGHVQNSAAFCAVYDPDKLETDCEELSSGTFDWSETLVGVVLGAQLYPNTFMPLLAGCLADRFGAKWLTVVAVMLPGVLSAVIPIAANVNVYLLIGIMFIQGCCSSCLFSSLVTMYVNWFPANEMATATGTFGSGSAMGLVIMFIVAGYLCHFGHWPAVFYVTAAIHLPWIVGWLWVATDLPSQNKKISQEEVEYIQKTCVANSKKESAGKHITIPWGKILTSKPVWASICAKLAENFGYYLVLSKMPAYLERVFGFSMHHNGILNAMVHLGCTIVCLACGPISTWILKNKILSKTNTRKVFESLSLIGSAICILAIPFLGCHSTSVITLLIVAMMIFGCVVAGDWPIVAEFAPDIAGTVFGFCYVIGILSSFFAPLVAGILLDENPNDIKQWNILFYLTATFMFICSTIFNLFASADPQPWAVIEDVTNKIDDNKIKQQVKLKS